MIGWWPAIVYSAVGFVCWSVGGARREGLERVVWALLSVSLLLSGLLRSYAVQSRITDSWREAARQQAWYDARRLYQSDVLLTGGIVALAMGICLIFVLRAVDATTRIAVAGACLLGAASLLYVVSMHGLDAMFGMTFFGLRVRWAVDASGILLILGATFAYRRKAPKMRSGG